VNLITPNRGPDANSFEAETFGSKCKPNPDKPEELKAQSSKQKTQRKTFFVLFAQNSIANCPNFPE